MEFSKFDVAGYCQAEAPLRKKQTGALFRAFVSSGERLFTASLASSHPTPQEGESGQTWQETRRGEARCFDNLGFSPSITAFCLAEANFEVVVSPRRLLSLSPTARKLHFISTAKNTSIVNLCAQYIYDTCLISPKNLPTENDLFAS